MFTCKVNPFDKMIWLALKLKIIYESDNGKNKMEQMLLREKLKMESEAIREGDLPLRLKPTEAWASVLRAALKLPVAKLSSRLSHTYPGKTIQILDTCGLDHFLVVFNLQNTLTLHLHIETNKVWLKQPSNPSLAGKNYTLWVLLLQTCFSLFSLEHSVLIVATWIWVSWITNFCSNKCLLFFIILEPLWLTKNTDFEYSDIPF